MNEDIKRIFVDTVTTYNFSNKEIGDEVLKELYELTKWGATSFNCSPLRLVFLKSEEAKNRIDPYLMDANKVNVKKAPVCVIIGMAANERDLWIAMERVRIAGRDTIPNKPENEVRVLAPSL